jgi:polar amino acid transport system substrate-binding protein
MWTGPLLLPLQALAKSMGVKLTPVPASWSNMVAGLQAGKYDIAAGLDITPDRSLSIMYTDPYYDDHGVWVVPRNSNLNSTEDIRKSGLPVAESQGSAHEEAVKAVGFETLSVDSWANAIQTVKAGRAAAQFSDYGNALGQVRSDKSLAIVVPNPELWVAPVSYGVPQDIDEHSLQTINVSIRQSQNSGERDRAFAEVGYLPIEDLGSFRK